MTENELDQIFHALSHRVRRHILDQLRSQPGQGVGELATHFDVSRIAVMNHLGVLEKVGLVVSQKDGRIRRLYLNAMPIHEVYTRWTDAYGAFWMDRLSTIKQLAEDEAMEVPQQAPRQNIDRGGGT